MPKEMMDPNASLITDPVRMADVWSDKSYLDQGVPYPPEMAAAPTSTPMNTSRRSRRSWFEKRPATNFEIKVESSEKQQMPFPKRRRESEEPEVLTLTHFTAPPRIGYGKMKPGEIKDRTLLLRNPHDYEQTVRVEKVPEKKHFSVDSKCFTVGAGETYPLTITWSPKDAGNFREMILMQVDKAYRLQAYVFGCVAAPPQKKKTRKGGLLSTKVTRPFSVIHTASLKNIDQSYSPEKMTTGQSKVVNKISGRSTVNSRNSGESRSSQCLSENAVNKENTEKVEHKSKENKQKNHVSGEKTVLKKLLPRDKKDDKIPKKRMRRSNTYSNVSGLGLPVPIINGETVQGHTGAENHISDIKQQIDMCNISGFEVIESKTLNISNNNNKQTVNLLPSFLEPDDKIYSAKSGDENVKEEQDSFVEVDSLENETETNLEKILIDRKSLLEHSFVEIQTETAPLTAHINTTELTEKPLLNIQNHSPDSKNGNSIVDKDLNKSSNHLEESKLRSGRIMKTPALNLLNKENSFIDSLNETAGDIEPPSFLSPDSFVENAVKYKLRRSARKGNHHDNVLSPTNMIHLKNVLNSSRTIVSPDSFVSEMSSAKKQMLRNRLSEEELVGKELPSPETVLNDSIPHNIVIQQLESVKANLHNHSSEKENQNKSCSHHNTDADRSEDVIADRRETFIKKQCPRFSVPGSDLDIRRGTFVIDAKKAKLLEHQQPSGASPRRTTFTVLRNANINATKTRARSDETPRTQRRRTRSQTKNGMLSENLKPEMKAQVDENHKVTGKAASARSETISKAEKSISVKSETVTKRKSAIMEHEDNSTAKRLFSKDSLNSTETSDIEFKDGGEIPDEQTNEISRRCTLTVTKSRPSDALLNQAKNIEGINVNLFAKDKKENSLAGSERQLDSFNENEEDSLETSQKSSKNSTFEVSANKSILLNKSVIKNDSFPTTPCQLPNSPSPDLSRRSTHVVADPKVLDLSVTDRKQLFPTLVAYEEDSSEDKSSFKGVNDISPVLNEAVVIHNQTVKDETDSPNSNTRRRVSARKSVNTSGEKYSKNMAKSEFGKSKRNGELDNQTTGSETERGSDPSKCTDEVKLTIADTYTKENSNNNKSDQAYFVPFDNKQNKVIEKPVRNGPHAYLKKRSNTVVQNEDRIQSKRVKSDSDNIVEWKQKTVNTRVTRPRLKTTGSASERLERQVFKPKAPVKGVSQSKLILIKKTKTALPKHPLPFAAKNMYYDERWMEKQERGFVNWLNFILTPAEEYQSNEVKVKVDAGKLAIEVAKGDIKLAPTNEVLSFRAYSAHRKLNRLRKSACRLFQSEEVIKVVQKLEAEVESKRLRVRKDKMMHADLGVKQRILDTLLSYNPLWLRIGLETIYGEVLPLQSNSDVFGLSRFILTRLLNSPDIAEEYAHPTVPHLYRDGYAEIVAQHTLKKFMMLVYFLDKAKLARLIEHNPCLFCKDSDVKASKDLLHQFSRDYLSGEGDITRHLGYLGYKVAYTQTALDEFDFAVSKLAVDLRDGLRLTRVMEFLNSKLELSRTLRVPSISRLQKVHNVEVVFKTLEEQGIQTGKVTARDIVDGHREKTLQLLWTIILHYQVELLLNEEQLKEEISILQKSLKVKSQLQNLLSYDQKPRRESAEPDLHTQNPRLNLLLKWCRTVCAFYNIKIENFTVSFSDGRALCYIVHHYHPGLLPRETIQSETTMTHMEDMEKKTQQNLTASFNDSCNSSAAFGDLEDPEVFERLLNNEKENYKILFEKVKELGGIPLMLKWSDMSNTIPDERVVVTYLLYLCARLLDIRHESRAARVIQLAWRKYQLRVMEKELKVKNQAASIIQAAIRKYLAHRLLERQELSAICIQRVWRGHQGRQLVKKLREEKALAEQRKAVVLLQRTIKQYLQRRRYLQMKQSVIRLQACCRGYLQRQKLSSAAVTIQKWVRGHQVRRQLQEKRNSAVVIQAHIRGHLARMHLQKLHKSAAVIQTVYRTHKAKVIQHQKYCKMKEACITIQRRFRKYLGKKKCKRVRAVVKIQSCVRGYIARKHFSEEKTAVIKIQAACKTLVLRKSFINIKKAVTVLQKHVRCYLVAKQQQIQYQSMKKAAILIQASWRMVKQRQIFKVVRKSTTTIQASIRMFLERKRFERLKKAVIICQNRYRAKHEAVAGRHDFLVKRGAAITIQALFRGHMVLKEIRRLENASVIIQSAVKSYIQRKQYLAFKLATVTVQRLRRAIILGQKERCKYLALKCAAVKIQTAFRGYRIRKEYQTTRRKMIQLQSCVRAHQQRLKYQKLKRASRVIQKRWRAELVARQHVADFQRTKNSIILIQSYIRMSQQREQYQKLRKAAVLLQSVARMKVQKKNYVDIRKSALVLQKRFRAKLEGEKCRHEYLVCLGAVITIQSAYRGYCLRKDMERQQKAVMKIQSQIRMFLNRQRFLKLKKAVLTCQRQYKAKLEGQKCRQQYLVSLGAVITIQFAIRGYNVRKEMARKQKAATKIQSCVLRYLQRGKYQQLKRAIITCQRLFRAKLAGRLQRCDYLKRKSSAIKIQSVYRKFSCRQKYLADRSRIIKLQTCVRKYQIRKRFLEIKAAATIIQRRWRETLVTRQQRSEYQKLKKAAVLIQATWRMKCQRRKFDYIKMSGVKMQSVVRMMLERKRFRALKSAAKTIQKHYRLKCLADECRKNFLITKGAAITIQALIRGHLVRKDLQDKVKAATIIQSHFKGHCERLRYLRLKKMTSICQERFRAKLIGRKVQSDYKAIRKGVVSLQAVVRGHAERSKYLKLRNTVLCLQSCFRGNKTRSHFRKLKQAVAVIQRRYRSNVVAKQQRMKYLLMQRASIKIQSCFRMRKLRNSYLETMRSVIKLQSLVRMVCVRRLYLQKKESAVKIQQWFRGVTETKRLAYKFLITRGAAITIQAAVRRFLARTRYYKICAARKIQAAYRCYRQRTKYQSTRNSVIVVQSVMRRYLARQKVKGIQVRHRAAILIQQRWIARREAKQERVSYLRLKHAASVCQSAFRAKSAMLEARKKFLSCKKSAITIQSVVRGHLMRKLLKRRNFAAVVIQKSFKCYEDRRQFLRLRHAAVACQLSRKAKVLGRKERNSFLNVRKAVVKLQAARRGAICRQEFVRTRNAAVKIQSAVRGYLLRKHLVRANQAASILQRRWRAELLCRQKVLEYQTLRDGVIMLQSVFRGNKARVMFSQMRAAVKIQSYMKMVVERTKYKTIQSSAVKVQAFIKMWRARKRYLELQEQRQKEREAHLARVVMVTKVNMAAIRIQRCYRKYRITKLAKQRLHSVLIIQRWVRAKLVRLHFLQTRERICHLQAAIRSWLSRRQSAAKVIQRVARKWLANKQVRQECKAAVKIQALWRGYSLRRKSKSKRLTLVRQRVEKANASATEDKKLGNRTSSALDYLLNYSYLSPVLDALQHLDVATRLSPVCCERMIEVNALSVLYRLVNGCNRSLPAMEIIKYTVNILLNLAKYEKTRHAVYSEEEAIHTIVELIQRYREKKGSIFTKACTLLGILALDNSFKTLLLGDKKLVERLQSIHSLTARKHKLEQNQRITRARMNATFNTTFLVKSPVKRHKIKPDWLLHRDKLSDFDDPLKAINFVLGNLGISTK